MNWGYSMNNYILRFVGKGYNKEKGRYGWFRIEKEVIRMINKIRSRFFEKK